jgi:multimeric flavodoxin WrbA
LGISASTRVWGNSEIAVRRVLLSAMEAGAGADFVRLSDLRVDPCRGCFKCLAPAGACAIADDVAGLIGRAASADAMVLAAPVYFGLPPAILVGLLDRLLVVANRDDAADRARPAVAVTLMGNAEWRGVAEPFVNLAASLLGFEVIESVSAVAEGPGELLGDSRVVERLAACGHLLGATSGWPRGLASGPSEDMALPANPSSASRIERGAEAGESRASSVRPFGWNPTPSGLSPISASPDHSSRGTGEAPNLGRCPTCRSDFFRLEGGHVACPVCGARGDLAAYTAEGRFVRIGSEERWGRGWLKRHVASWIKPSMERYKSRRRQALRDLQELRRLYSLKEGDGSKP